MNAATARRLLELNRGFYDAFAADFADSRRALQPGMTRALEAIAPFRSMLDVGCGDGRVGRALAEGVVAPAPRRYVGVDYSHNLVLQAPATFPNGYVFMLCDVARAGWSDDVDEWLRLRSPARGTPQSGARPALRRFDAAVCFSALHHIPGARRRLRLMREMRSLLKPGGRCVVSVWQFLHVPRLARKIAPWSEAGLRPEQVDEGDVVVDWRRGGRGLRYVHHFTQAELIDLCRRAGFDMIETYRSDGQTGDMGLYIVLKAVLY